MARRSAADLATPVVGERPRPAPPPHLSDEAREVWIETIEAVSRDWLSTFAGCETMLAVYCEAVVLNQRLATMVSMMSGGDWRWPGLVKLFHNDCALLLRYAEMLRLLPRSSGRPDHGYEGRGAARPWVN